MWMAGVAVLLREAPSVAELEAALAGRAIVKRVTAEPSGMGGSFGLVVPMRPEVNGYVVVDLFARAWPDDFGDEARDPVLFGGWTLGFFGPFAYPGGLARAVAHAYAFPGAAAAVAAHRACVRVRASYVLGAAKGAPVAPADYDAEAELRFVTEIALAVAALPTATAYFDPSGERLLDRAELAASLAHADAHDLAPLDAWTNVRLFGVDGKHSMMDTVGLAQLGEVDHEAWFARGTVEPDDVARWLRNLTAYVHGGVAIEDGHTADGPGGAKWRAERVAEGASAPPRPVVRWCAEGASPPWPARAASEPGR